MKRFLVVAAAILFPLPALATCTWTTDAGTTSGKVVCTATNESAIAGTAGTTVGWQADKCAKGMVFTVCTDSGQQVTAALTLSMFLYNPWAALWSKAPDLDLTSATIAAAQRCQSFPGIWSVVPGGRVAVIPTAGTVDGGSVTIWWACN